AVVTSSALRALLVHLPGRFEAFYPWRLHYTSCLLYSSLRLQPRGLDDRAPFGHLGLEERGAFLRRIADRHVGDGGELLLHVRQRESGDDEAVKLRDDLLGR